MKSEKIQMVDLHSQYLGIKEEIDQAIQSVIASSAFINGPAVKSFCKELSEYQGIPHVIPCGNGTDALQIAMLTLGLKAGDEVLLPAFTYVATAEVIALLNLTPIFVDVDDHTFNIDIADIKRKITKRTKAIVPVHLFGQCADMEEVMQISREYGLFVIEDNAQSIGAEYTFSDGKRLKAGTMGDIGCLSFFPSKNLGCFGDGGALLIKDEDLAERARMISNHGQRVKYEHEIVGCNSRLDSLQAAILSVKLKYLDKYIERRKKVAEQYTRTLGRIAEIQVPFVDSKSSHVYHQYTIKLERIDRNELRNLLRCKGIPTMVYYPIPLHQQKAYLNIQFRKGSLPISEELSERVLSLPIHTEMDEMQVELIISKIFESFNEIK